MSSDQVCHASIRQNSNENAVSPRDEEKQRQLDQKIEEMRRKNEMLRRRYEEIEADKRNANLNSKIAATKFEGDEGDDSEEDVDPDHKQEPRRTYDKRISNDSTPGDAQQSKSNKSRGRLVPNATAMPYQQHGQHNRHLPAHDAPPPDPKYKFLDDPVRQGEEFVGRDRGRGMEFRRGTGRAAFKSNRYNEVPSREPVYVGRGRGRNDRGGQHQPMAADNMEYSRWKEERDRIDAERLARQQTSSGQWKREWDVDKNVEREDQYVDRFDRRPMQSRGRGYQHQRRDYARPHSGNADVDHDSYTREGTEHQYRPSFDGNDGQFGSNYIPRRILDDGRSLKITTQREPVQNYEHRRGRGRGAFSDSRGSHDNPSVFGFGNERQPYISQDSQEESDTRGYGQDESEYQQQRRPQEIQPEDRHNSFQTRKPTFDNRTYGYIQHEASLDTLSSEYASPEPQPQGQQDDYAQRNAGTEWPDEDEQWEDVEDTGENAEAYYDLSHHGDKVDHPLAGDSELEAGHDDATLASKLKEMERQMILGVASVINPYVSNEQHDDNDTHTIPAIVAQFKESVVVRRRQTTDDADGGPDLAADDIDSLRARHESLDQIERDMIATMTENIQAVEAALGQSEEDLELLLSQPGKRMKSPMLEGAVEDDIPDKQSHKPVEASLFTAVANEGHEEKHSNLESVEEHKINEERSTEV